MKQRLFNMMTQRYLPLDDNDRDVWDDRAQELVQRLVNEGYTSSLEFSHGRKISPRLFEKMTEEMSMTDLEGKILNDFMDSYCSKGVAHQLEPDPLGIIGK
jgi:hypothetical protein